MQDKTLIGSFFLLLAWSHGGKPSQKVRVPPCLHAEHGFSCAILSVWEFDLPVKSWTLSPLDGTRILANRNKFESLQVRVAFRTH